jgi:hypothetical protein
LSSIEQTVNDLPTGEKVTLELGLAQKKDDAATSNGVEVHVSGLGRVFPSSGGIKNPTFIDGFWDSVPPGAYKYVTPKDGWASQGNVVIAASCNGPWGGLCTGSGASHYLTIQSSGSKIYQTVENLPVGPTLTLKFFAACRPNYGTDEKMVVSVNGVVKGTYLCPTIGSSTSFVETEITFTADSAGSAILEWKNDSPAGDRTVFLDNPTIVLPSAGSVFTSGAGRSCAERCSDLGLACLAGHSDNGAGGDQSSVHCRGASTEDSTLNLKWGDSTKYASGSCSLKTASKMGCCRCGAGSPTPPYNLIESATFEQHRVTFVAPSSNAEIKIINAAPNDGKTHTVLVDNPQIYWAGTPGPVAEANLEFGSKSNEKMSVTKLIVSPVSGKDTCGPVMLERCGSWDSASQECSRYHTVASFDQSAEYTVDDSVATDARRWRISPLTTVPVEFSGQKCKEGTSAGAEVEDARGCQAICDNQATCSYYAWNPEGETGSMPVADRCVWSTDAQCAEKSAGAYVTYKKEASDIRAIDFPQTGTTKFVRMETPSSFVGNKDFTWSMWIKLTDSGAFNRLISKQRNGGTGVQMYVSKQQIAFVGMGSPTGFWGTDQSDTNLEVGVWYHVAATLTNGVANLYIDGELKSTASYDSSQAASTDGAQPIVLGREWDETSSGWTSSNTNLLSGRKLTGVRMAHIAVWSVALSADEITSLSESTSNVEANQVTKIVVYLKGVGSDGTLQVGTNGLASSAVKALNKNDADSTSTETVMDAVEDSPAITSSSPASASIKECGMTVSILSGSSATGSACLSANNKVCTPGETKCTQQECNTPGSDMARIWAVCQPAATDADLQIAPADAVDSTITGGKGQTVSCPTGRVIAFGWALHTTNDEGDKSDCIRSNNKMCTKGDESCTQDACNSPGNDVQTIYLFCQEPSKLHGSPVVAQTGGGSKDCPAGTSGQVCNDILSEQTLQCPNNAQIVFGFGLHSTSTLDKPSESMVLRNLGTTCGYTKRSCSFPFARDTAGDDVTFMFALCAGALDFESQPSFDLTLEVTDPGGLTGRSTVTVEVDNRNEQPRVYDSVHEVHENANIGTLVGKPVFAVDADEEDALRYYVTGGDGASIFEIGSCDGQISVKRNEIDFELKNEYTLKVLVEDDGVNPDKLTDTATITIKVVDVNEPPKVMDMTCAIAEADDFARREATSIRLVGGSNAMVGRLEYRVWQVGICL